jgi:dienelactone hydrolase
MTRLTVLAVLLFATCHVCGADADPTRVLPPGQKSDDARFTKVRTLNDKDFDFHPPASKELWEARRRELREQILVATGLWPLPEKTPLNAVVHGSVDRGDYTVEKVFFASYPGHYVSGSLYRPKNVKGKAPGVLCPHGHWANGRFYDAGEKGAADAIKTGGEFRPDGARYPLQARCQQLARMGCIVFHYDMVGNADSTDVKHREGFTDADAELRLQSFMGLQTWNSIRALDFLLTLPDVDPKRIAVTGASGGGTQTFILCAIDDRPAVAFPAVMVGTAMQGGCVCENCSYLRIGTGNVEFAGMFAPKPLAMSGADDWTIDIERKGLPQLQELYRLYGAEDRVLARCFPQFKHNYNQVSREMMYDWFNKHLGLGINGAIQEHEFKPLTKDEMTVYDVQHPHPKDAVGAEKLREYLTAASDKQIEALLPKDAKSYAEYRRVFEPALRTMIADKMPGAADIESKEIGERQERDGLISRRYLIGRKGSGEKVPAFGITTKGFNGTVVVWIHPEGKSSLFKDGKLVPAAKQILDGKAGILAVDVFNTGELTSGNPLPAVNAQFAGYTFGYNRPLLAQRAHDILTAIAFARTHEKTKVVHLVGFEKAGPWVLLARAAAGDTVARTAADADSFRFEKVRTVSDEMMLPGGLKYAGLYALAALAAPHELYVHHYSGTGSGHWLKAVYAAAGAPTQLQRTSAKVGDDTVIAWLLH